MTSQKPADPFPGRQSIVAQVEGNPKRDARKGGSDAEEAWSGLGLSFEVITFSITWKGFVPAAYRQHLGLAERSTIRNETMSGHFDCSYRQGTKVRSGASEYLAENSTVSDFCRRRGRLINCMLFYGGIIAIDLSLTTSETDLPAYNKRCYASVINTVHFFMSRFYVYF